MSSTNFLTGVLEDFPVLKKKLWHFCQDHSLQNKPALIWQCSTAQPNAIPWNREKIGAVLRAGVDDGMSDSLWHGFHSSSSFQSIFDGLAAYRADDDLGWMTEAHSDGHFIGGLWEFTPVVQNGGLETHVLAKTHTEAFSDFAELAVSVNRIAEAKYPCQLTCTLINAHRIGYQHNYSSRVVGPLKRQHLQWQVRSAESEEKIMSVINIMANELLQAFGQRALPFTPDTKSSTAT